MQLDVSTNAPVSAAACVLPVRVAHVEDGALARLPLRLVGRETPRVPDGQLLSCEAQGPCGVNVDDEACPRDRATRAAAVAKNDSEAAELRNGEELVLHEARARAHALREKHRPLARLRARRPQADGHLLRLVYW